MDGLKSKVLLADDEAKVLTLLEMTLINDERYEIPVEEALAICEHPQDLGHDRGNAHGTGP